MRTTYVSAGVIAVAAALWLASGELREPRQTGPKTLAEQNARLDAAVGAADQEAVPQQEPDRNQKEQQQPQTCRSQQGPGRPCGTPAEPGQNPLPPIGCCLTAHGLRLTAHGSSSSWQSSGSQATATGSPGCQATGLISCPSFRSATDSVSDQIEALRP